jgi:hypothetical protein
VVGGGGAKCIPCGIVSSGVGEAKSSDAGTEFRLTGELVGAGP